MKVVRLLKKAHLDLQDISGMTALHMAAKKDSAVRALEIKIVEEDFATTEDFNVARENAEKLASINYKI